MPIISGKRLAALTEHLGGILDADTLRLRGGKVFPSEVLEHEPANDPSGDDAGHRAFVVREPLPEKTSGGIHIPQVVRDTDKLTKGWIIAASPCFNGGEAEAVLGMRIMFGKYSGGSILLGQESDIYLGSFMCIRAGDIWAVSIKGGFEHLPMGTD